MRHPYSFPIALMAIVSTCLTGCADTIKTLADSQDSRILNPDSVQGQRGPKGFFSLQARHPNEEAANRLRGDPPTRNAYGTYSDPCAPPGSKGNPAIHVFLCRQQQIELAVDKAYPPGTGTAPSQQDYKDYVSSGIALSDELCDEWFLRLGVTQITLKQSSDIISATGSLTSAILAFTRSNTQAIGLAASTFGTAKSFNDSLSANYVVSVDLPTLQESIHDYRVAYATSILSSNDPLDYYQARRVVMAYDDTCSALFVKHFVSNKIQAGGSNAGVDTLVNQAIATFITGSTRFFTVKPTVNQLSEIYALYYLTPTAAQTAAFLADLTSIKVMIKPGDAAPYAVNMAPAADQTIIQSALRSDNIDSFLAAKAQALLDAPPAAAPAPAAAVVGTPDPKSQSGAPLVAHPPTNPSS